MIVSKGLLCTLVVLLLALYLYYPAPELSSNLNAWTIKGRFHTFKDQQIFFIDEQKASETNATVLCLHGFPTFSYDWVEIWPSLLKKFKRVVALDFIGHGFSDKPMLREVYTVFHQADIVEDLLSALGIVEFHILAHDYGDTVAQELLARYEERKRAGSAIQPSIQSVCLLNGGIFPETNFPRSSQKMLTMPFAGRIVASLMNIFTFRRSFSEIFGPTTRPSEELLQDLWTGILQKGGHHVLPLLLDYIKQRWTNKVRWTNVLRTSNIPVHVVYGPADPVNPPGFIEFYKQHVPNSGITVLQSHIGHYPQLEDAGATVTAYFNFIEQHLHHQLPQTVQ